MKYRSEIDGLRSIAVVPVILFHAHLPPFPGGYVGVDVFFVISGYLITSLLLSDLAQGRFSLIDFYERRARRILPALFFVILATLPFAWMWLFPDALQSFFQSIGAIVLFVSNILFWRQEGYFAPVSELKPLLHTWSLAVEEQFYLFFPPFLWLLWRFGWRAVLICLALCALVSLIVSDWATLNTPGAAFYLAPSRAWELLAGSLAALWLHRHPQPAHGGLAALGLAAILAANILYDGTTPFPGRYALLPVAGTVLVILCAGPGTLVGRLLSWRPLVAIGLVSYSAYLWHQPIFALARHRSALAPESWVMLCLIALTFVLAGLSWYFVEQPFRHRSGPRAFSRRAIFGLSATAGAALLGLSIAGHLGAGFPDRHAPSGLSFAAVEDTAPQRYFIGCNHDILEQGMPKTLPLPGCRFRPEDRRPRARAVLIGDSHADMLSVPLRDALVARGIALDIVTIPGCPPLRGFNFLNRKCDDVNALILDYMHAEQFDIIFAGFRPQQLFTGPFDNGEGGVEPSWGTAHRVLYDADYLSVAPEAAIEDKAGALMIRGTADFLNTGADVVVVAPVPEAGWNIAHLMMNRAAFSAQTGDYTMSTDQGLYRRRNAPILTALATLEDPKLHLIQPQEVLCNTDLPGRCVNILNGVPYYADDDHLSHLGASLLTQHMIDTLAQGGLRAVLGPP